MTAHHPRIRMLHLKYLLEHFGGFTAPIFSHKQALSDTYHTDSQDRSPDRTRQESSTVIKYAG